MLRCLTTTAALAATMLAISPALADDAADPHQAAPVQAGALDKEDTDFLMDTARSGLFEVQASKEAVQRATNPAVKTYAQHVADDHTKLNQDLSQLAQKKGVVLPQDLDQDQKDRLDALRKKTGADFDKSYVEAMAKEHSKAVSAFEKRAKNAKDPDVRTFAATALPTLRDHETQAKALEKQLKK